MDKLTVIIPTLWQGSFIYEMLEALNASAFVDEIVLIDNNPNSGYKSTLEKVRHIHTEQNLYVNPSWNYGVSLSKNNNLMLLSDDVRFDVTKIPLILEQLDKKCVIGVHNKAWENSKTFNITKLDGRPHSWGTLVFVRKEDWVDIPEELLIWFGDDWIASKAKTILGVEGIDIETKNETTSSLPRFSPIKRNDVIHWYHKVLGWPMKQTLRAVTEFGLHMNNCIFTTHHTLTKEHAYASLRSLLALQTNPNLVWNNFIIYNTHPDEISDEWLVETVQSLDKHQQIINLLVFPYQDGAYTKTLTQDTINHFQILVENEMNLPGKTLLLKSDYCVSNNFNQIFLEMQPINTIWSLPIHNAKEKVSMEDVYNKLKSPTFDYVDEVTYYRGGTNFPHTPGTMDKPYDERSLLEDGVNETDPRILFISHNIQNDYNLHVFTNDTLSMCLQVCKQVYNPNSTWGGAHDLFNKVWDFNWVTRSTEIRAYGVHMYHGIISPNRNQDRTDPRKVIEGERY